MNNPLEIDSVVDSVRDILAQLLAIGIDEIDTQSCVVADLNADSLDVVDLTFQLGQRYGCVLPKTSVLDHAVEVCGGLRSFISSGGLNENGRQLLMQSLNAYTPEQLRIGMIPSSVFAETTVFNWASQCYRLFDYLPAKCPDCQGEKAVLNERQQVVCAHCHARLTPRDGDEVSRQLVKDFVQANLAEAV